MTVIDVEQLQQIFDRHGPTLVLYARRWCVAPDDAVQEALIDLAQQQPPPSDPVAWIYQAVRWRAMNLARSQQRRDKYQLAAAQTRDDWFSASDAGELDSGELEQLLEDLPDLDREILVARIWGDLSFTQIAELVEKPLSTVHRRYKLTLQTLQKQFGQRVQD